MLSRTMVEQQKIHQPVQFDITKLTRDAVSHWIKHAKLKNENYLFPSRIKLSPHITTRQYSRIVHSWIKQIGLEYAAYGTHLMRRTKASLIYKRTKNLRAVKLFIRPHKIGKHCSLSWHRSGRRFRNSGTNRSLIKA
jgi:hypothetical protein